MLSAPVRNRRSKVYGLLALACLGIALFGVLILADIRPSYSKVVCQREQYPGHWFITGPALIGVVLFTGLSATAWESRKKVSIAAVMQESRDWRNDV